MKNYNDSLFLPYQRKWIEDKSPLKIMEKSRQVGVSWASAYGLVREQAMKNEGGYDCWVSSRDEVQAELFIEDCGKFAEILHEAAAIVNGTILAAEKPIVARTLRFANGRCIHALSSNPNAQAGKRGTRLLDEFALHPNPKELYNIALPGVTWGGRLEIVSTHRGEGNFFNTLITEITKKGNPKGFSYHRVTLYDALAQGFLQKLKGKLPSDDPRQKMNEANYVDYIRSQCADEAAFRQEYCCEPSENETQFLPYGLIASVQRDEAEELPEVEGTLYIGADLGRTRDRTVFIIIEQRAEKCFVRSVTSLANESFSAQEAALEKLMAHPNFAGIALDATGLGRQFAERLQEKHGRKVTPVIFTDERKAELAYGLKRVMEDKMISIPASNELRNDLAAVETNFSASGNLIFSAPRNTTGHADAFWALALALQAARKTVRAVAIIPPAFVAMERNGKSFL